MIKSILHLHIYYGSYKRTNDRNKCQVVFSNSLIRQPKAIIT